MISGKHRAWVEVDLDALEFNFRNIKSLVLPSTKIMCVVKADAYGHGYKEVSKHLSSLGADCFAVATLEEAVQLRKSGINEDILILGYTENSACKDIVLHDITATVFDFGSAKAISEEAKRQGKTAKIHIKIDTGMTRIGYEVCEETADEIIKISKLKNIFVEGMFSHLSKADEFDKNYAKMQFEKFLKMDSLLKERGLAITLKHISNSAAIMDLPEFQLDMVRPGIILYGIYPSDDVKKDKLPLKHVMSIKAHITRILKAKKGTKVSYGGVYEVKKDGEKIAVVPIGYADGFSRLFSGKAKMIVNGKFVPTVGRICMDQCMINVTSVNNICVGDEVIIMGKEGDSKILSDDLAEIMGTIGYEIVCMAGKRLPRIYTREKKADIVLNYLENW